MHVADNYSHARQMLWQRQSHELIYYNIIYTEHDKIQYKVMLCNMVYAPQFPQARAFHQLPMAAKMAVSFPAAEARAQYGGGYTELEPVYVQGADQSDRVRPQGTVSGEQDEVTCCGVRLAPAPELSMLSMRKAQGAGPARVSPLFAERGFSIRRAENWGEGESIAWEARLTWIWSSRGTLA